MVQEPPFLPLTRSGNRYLKRLDTSDHQAEILGNVVVTRLLHNIQACSYRGILFVHMQLYQNSKSYHSYAVNCIFSHQFRQQDFQFVDENLFEILVILEQRVEIIFQCWFTSNGVCIYPQSESGNWKPSTLLMLFPKLQTCRPLNLYPISHCFFNMVLTLLVHPKI